MDNEWACVFGTSDRRVARASQLREKFTFPLRETTFFLLSTFFVLLYVRSVGAQSSGLPTDAGWSALPASTSLAASGAWPANNFGGDPYSSANNCRNVIRAWNGGGRG